MANLRTKRKARGVAIIEAAIVFPLLLLLTFGVIEYGWALLKSQQITNATRQAARIAARPDSTNADIQTLVTSLMTNSNISDYQLTFPADITSILPGETLTVTITVSYESIQLAGAPFVPMPSDLQASVTMAKEGP